MREAACVLLMLASCSRAASVEDPPVPWKPPAQPAWDDLPNSDGAALSLAAREATQRKGMRSFDASALAGLRADASHLIAGLGPIAARYDAWIDADASKPGYIFFGTLHDSRAQLDAAASIVFRMTKAWGLALEQFRSAGFWSHAPSIDSADDADLATLGRAGSPLDRAALTRMERRQMRFDHAAWKFDYLDEMTSLVLASRGAGVPLLGCDMPPELRASLTPGGEPERALRELHCARAMRSAALHVSAAHQPDGGLSEDDSPPPERFAAIVGARHAEPDGIARFVEANARVALVRVLGGRPRDAQGEEADLAAHLVVTDIVLVRGLGPDILLLPDDTWGGTVERASDRGEAPNTVTGLPRANLSITSDAPARFAITDASVDVASKPEWISVRAGHQAYMFIGGGRTFIGAIDVPDSGWADVHFSPKDRAMRVVIHRPL